MLGELFFKLNSETLQYLISESYHSEAYVYFTWMLVLKGSASISIFLYFIMWLTSQELT